MKLSFYSNQNKQLGYNRNCDKVLVEGTNNAYISFRIKDGKVISPQHKHNPNADKGNLHQIAQMLDVFVSEAVLKRKCEKIRQMIQEKINDD